MAKNDLDDIFADFPDVQVQSLDEEPEKIAISQPEPEPESEPESEPFSEENMERVTGESHSLPQVSEQFDLSTIRIGNDVFDALIMQCVQVLADLPLQGPDQYEYLRHEITDTKVEYGAIDTPSQVGDQLAVVQAYKDRVFEIYADAHQNYVTRQRVTELLLDAYSAISGQSSQDKRRGEASLILGPFVLQSVQAEGFFQFCKQIATNLEARQSTLSRRLTCMQIQSSIGNYNFNATSPDVPTKNELRQAAEEKVQTEAVSPVEW